MKAAAKKTLSVISGVLIALFLLLAALSLAITIFYSAKGEDAVLFGCQFRIVLTGSMEPEIGAGDLVAVRVAERDGAEFYEELEVGDVVTFYWRGASDKDEYIVTHRITEIKKTSTGFEYTLKGDAVESDTQTVTSASGDIIGKVTWHSAALGAFVRFIRSKAGIVCCMILPALLVAALESWHIAGLVREGRREKRENAAARDKEIETLKREIEELKKERESKNE